MILEHLPLRLDFNSLIALPELSQVFLNQSIWQLLTSPLFVGKVKAKLNFEAVASLTNLEILGALDVYDLKIEFKQNILPGEFKWIQSLQNLKTLSLFGIGSLNRNLLNYS